MDLSTLKLVMEKGPREGEALEYKSKPGFTIRIGRIVRGNTFAIKDNGISSKHLSIVCCSQDKWVVKDLYSSNGTLLNSSLLPPLTEHDLGDGDVLKIGEVTSIRVQISHFTDPQPVGRNLRSGARVLRTADSEGVQLVSGEGNLRGRGRGRDRGRGRGRGLDEGKGDADSGAEGEIVLQKPEINSEISENVQGITQKGVQLRTRSSKNVEDKDATVGGILEKDGATECKAEPPISSRRITRSRVKKKDNSTFTSDPQLAGSDNREVPESVAPKEKQNTRATRGRKKKVVETESAQSVTVGELSNIAEEEEQLASELITEQENCNQMEIVMVKPEPQSNIDGIISKGEHSSKETMSEIAQKDGDLACQLNFEHETRDEPEASLDQDDRREPDTGAVNLQESTASIDRDEEVEIAPDLNKMTVGEWFDYLERVLPKQIRAETDKVAQDMRKRSQQFHEFVLQQQKDKGKPPLG